MTKQQFRVLYREFLFRIVDRELLSTHARGDMSQLLLQIATVLIFLSLCFSLPAIRFLNLDRSAPAILGVWFEWNMQHFLIATTMLIVGLFAVLSWRSMFPDHRDVLVLAPLPIRAHTILLAKLTAVATALIVTVVALHALGGVIWPLALDVVTEARTVQAFTSDPKIPPVGLDDLERVLQQDFAGVLRSGPLAPDAGGGLAIGVYQQGARRVFAYGRASPDSIFQIGSITKPFTALALAQMVEEGRVRLNQPVRTLIPKARVPTPPGLEITLLDLATHHSGLPPLPWNLRPRDPANPYVDYDAGRLYAFLENRGSGRDPAEPFVYSNLGFGLLAHALTVRADVDYGTLIRQTVAEPLGLHDTVVELSAEQSRRFLQGYDDRRRPVRPWDLNVFAGAGALRSTAPDMLTWLEANLHPERSAALAAALASSQQPRAPRGREGNIALAWWMDSESGDFRHGGAVAGFTADAFFNRHEDLAVIVLSNTGPGSALSADVVGEHVRARLAGKPAVAVTEIVLPAGGSAGRWLRLLAAYWFTMLAAGTFMFGLAASVQGLAAAILPHRVFLRASSLLQLGAFGLIVGVYFLQPMSVNPSTLLAAQQRAFASSPSYWFLGLFQAVAGSPAMAPLARQAWIALALSIVGILIAYGLSYVRTLPKIVETPDIMAGVRRFRWLPKFGGPFPTAIVQFSLRTLFRSGQHRVLLAFYWGIGFALTAMLLKTPRGQQLSGGSVLDAWQEGSVPLIVASIWMMAFAVLAARLAFSLPRDLSANWIFRITPIPGVRQCIRARRRALMAVSVLPVWAISAMVFLRAWPTGPALGHLGALGLLGFSLIEIALRGTQKIPFTCSYLPGRSRVHLALYVAIMVLVPLTFGLAEIERDILQGTDGTVVMLAGLVLVWAIARWQTMRQANAGRPEAAFEDEPSERVLTLEVWDSRFGQ